MSLCSCVTRANQHTSAKPIPPCNVTNPLIRSCVAMGEKRAHEMEDCPLACKESIFNFEVSSSVWPSPLYYENYKNEHKASNKSSIFLSYDEFRETNLRLKIYYGALYDMVYKHMPLYQTSETFSSIGGHMALWLGLSIAAVVESFESVFSLFRKNKSNFQ